MNEICGNFSLKAFFNVACLHLPTLQGIPFFLALPSTRQRIKKKETSKKENSLTMNDSRDGMKIHKKKRLWRLIDVEIVQFDIAEWEKKFSFSFSWPLLFHLSKRKLII